MTKSLLTSTKPIILEMHGKECSLTLLSDGMVIVETTKAGDGVGELEFEALLRFVHRAQQLKHGERVEARLGVNETGG